MAENKLTDEELKKVSGGLEYPRVPKYKKGDVLKREVSTMIMYAKIISYKAVGNDYLYDTHEWKAHSDETNTIFDKTDFLRSESFLDKNYTKVNL